jgi:hypothetical protein
MSDATITASDRGAKGDTRALSMSLLYCSGGFYGKDPDARWPDADHDVRVVGWVRTGDDSPPGWYPEPSYGPVEGIEYPPIDQGSPWRGIRVTAASIINIHHHGEFGGVTTALGTMTSQLRHNGVVIYSETLQAPGFGSWNGGFDYEVTNVVAAAGDEFEISFWYEHWVDYIFYANLPADRNYNGNLRISGETLPGKPFLRASVNTTSPL